MEVKGTAVESLPKYIEAHHGKDGLDRWLDALSEDARREYASAILTSSWYPIREMFVEPTLRLCELFFSGDLEGARDVGHFSAELGLRGIYKAFIRLGSTKFLVQKASVILPTYYRPSAMKLSEFEKGRAVVSIVEFPDPHEVIEQRILGWIDSALKISGARNHSVDLQRSMLKGSETTDFLVTWT